MTKYTREAIRDAIGAVVEPFSPVDELVDQAGVDSYILDVATAVGCGIGEVVGGDPVLTEAADVAFLRGFLVGLKLGEGPQ